MKHKLTHEYILENVYQNSFQSIWGWNLFLIFENFNSDTCEYISDRK